MRLAQRGISLGYTRLEVLVKSAKYELAWHYAYGCLTERAFISRLWLRSKLYSHHAAFVASDAVDHDWHIVPIVSTLAQLKQLAQILSAYMHR